jgi:cell division protein FtsI/penicillin-binding protein 2
MFEINRIKVVKKIFIFFWVIGLTYVFYLQIISGKKYAKKAKGFQETTIELLAPRGRIYDRRGRQLVVNRSCFSISVLPQYLEHKRKEAAYLLASCGVKDFNTTYQELSKRKKFYWYQKQVDYDVGKLLLTKLKKAGLAGAISVVSDNDRYYPFRDIAASAIGFVGSTKPGNKKGWAGIEYEFDSLLSGKPGKMVCGLDGLGNIYYHPSYKSVPAVPGCDIYTTLDLDIQLIAYEELKFSVENCSAIFGSVLVLDCETGEILAMVDYPDFDPNHYERYKPKEWTPFAVTSEFEPGSSFKLVIMATALNSSNRESILKERYDVSQGYITISGKRIKDVHNWQVLDFPGIFIHSSNIGVSLLSQRLDALEFYLTARKLGFTLPTGIELPGEAAGYLDSPNRIKKALRFANNAFGQGLRTTLLQLANAYACVAQGGILLKPYIVKAIVSPTRGVLYQGQKTIIRRALDLNIANEMKDILERVVTEGSGKKAFLDEFEVCGKTGTAQKLVNGVYSAEKSLMTFVGFFPKTKPKYLIAVLIDEPKRTEEARFAGDVTCPLFKNIATRIIRLKQNELNSFKQPSARGGLREEGGGGKTRRTDNG